MRARVIRLIQPCFGVLALMLACSPASEKKGDGDSTGGNTSSSGGTGSGSGSGSGNMTGSGGSIVIGGTPCPATDPNCMDSPAPPGCGDGKLAADEACDDGNTASGDGCQANCLATESGFSCNPPGKACHELIICGDGIVGSSEQCDDGNKMAGDGCSATCKFEVGFKCDGNPSKCSATVCGDKIKEGAESCDDGNTVPFDGCSGTCQTEPNCTGEGCTSECGDGLLIDEECDDGNTKDGDGCSSTCKKEAGFECSQKTNCEKVNDSCVLRVPVIYRDFNVPHPDIEATCLGTDGGLAATPGLVEPTLVNEKPVATAAATKACITKLGDWYSDAGGKAIVRDIVLFDNEKGGFVNRYGAKGEQWGTMPVYNTRWCGNGDTACTAAPPQFEGCAFDPLVEKCMFPCPGGGAGVNDTCAGTVTVKDYYDGTPLFFPLDDLPKTEAWIDAKIPPQYGYNWQFEDQVLPVNNSPHVAGARAHNFHFTTQVVYWFKYDAKTTARLDFTGDDDVWVFVNGKLAVDLGGVHQPVDGGVSISAATAATYGLADGKVYKLTIFHAERKKESSSFRLTLGGFDTARSECTPICGDGIVSLGEQCDDGVNDGGYGECQPNCIIGPYCGDGVKQEGESCDDGNRASGDGCTSSCRVERND